MILKFNSVIIKPVIIKSVLNMEKRKDYVTTFGDLKEDDSRLT